jgi:transcriptional regulator with XRE-family HTH domain
MDEHQFGSKIRARREELGLSQNEIGMILGIDQGKVSLIEKGLRRIDVVKELPVLAKLLKVPVGWFFDQVEDKIPLEALVKQYFPDGNFTEMEMKRIGKFIEPIVQSYIENDPQLQKKIKSKKPN